MKKSKSPSSTRICLIESKIQYAAKVKEKMRRPQTGNKNAKINHNLSIQVTARKKLSNKWISETE